MRFIAKHGLDGLLVVLGIATVICMLAPGIALVAAISIIGLPITFLMALIPSVFFFLLTVRIAMSALRFSGGWVAAVGVALAIFTAVPWLINQGLDATARGLVDGDRNAIELPIASRSMAVVSQWNRFNRDQTACDDFCLRALLSGALDRVIVAAAKDQSGPLDVAQAATAFRMERRPSCPIVNLQAAVEPLKIVEPSPTDRPADPAEVMRLEIASGRCLIEEPAVVGDADAVARIGRIRMGPAPYSAGLDLFADTVRADRISYFQRRGDRFEEQYRWTGVEYYRLLPFLAPSYATGYGLEIANAFLRLTERINITEKYYENPDMTTFFTRTLGLQLQFNEADVDQLRTAALSQRLDAPGALDPVAAQIADDFFLTILMRRKMKQVELEHGLRIVADARIPVPRGIHVLAQYAKDMPAGTTERTGDVLLARLLTFDRPTNTSDRSTWQDQASALASALRYIPASGLAGHRAELERVAHSEGLRVPAWQALIRMSDFGAEAVPTLLYLIDDAQRFRKADDRDVWQHPYLAGLIGLCQMSLAGASAVQPLLARIDSGVIPLHASYRELTINTLLSTGAKPDAIWQRVMAGDPKADRQRFDSLVTRAAKRGPECSY